MRWSLVLLLSLFGLAMAGLTLPGIVSSSAAPIVWLPILVISAYVIGARAGGRYFLHGLAVGIVNSFWLVAVHALFVDTFLASNPREAAMLGSMPMPQSPRLMMAMVGPVVGAATGVVIGLLAMGAARLIRRRA